MKTQVLSPESIRGGLKKMGLLTLMLVACGTMLGFGMGAAEIVLMEAPAAVVSDTVTTSAAKEVSPDLLMSDVERRVTEFMPSRFPLDTLVRNIGRNERSNSLVTEWSATDYLPFKDVITADVVSTVGVAEISVANIDYFSLHQTLIVSSTTIRGTDNDYLALLVVNINKATKKISVVAINGAVNGAQTTVPAIPANTLLITCGRAKSEKDIQTQPSGVLPVKTGNFMQMFMVQIEESEYFRISKKEVDFGWSNFKSQSMSRLRSEIELSYILGSKGSTFDPFENNIKLTCDGIIRQGIKRYTSPSAWDTPAFNRFTKTAFVGNNGSDERFFMSGSDLIESISNAPAIQKQQGAGTTKVKHGITWSVIETNFGILNLKYAPMLDEAGMPNSGLVIDPANIGKKIMIPMELTELELRKSGQANVDAATIRETSCLAVYNPNTHMAINF